jgi:hypothetical protein
MARAYPSELSFGATLNGLATELTQTYVLIQKNLSRAITQAYFAKA